MGRLSLAAVLAGLAFCWGCGGDPSSTAGGLGGPAWTLTILSPDHGSTVDSRVDVEVAITGPAPASGATRDFDLALFLDGELIARSADSELELELPAGDWLLRVDALDAEGNPREDVLGDEILVRVRGAEEEPGLTL